MEREIINAVSKKIFNEFCVLYKNRNYVRTELKSNYAKFVKDNEIVIIYF